MQIYLYLGKHCYMYLGGKKRREGEIKERDRHRKRLRQTETERIQDTNSFLHCPCSFHSGCSNDKNLCQATSQ